MDFEQTLTATLALLATDPEQALVQAKGLTEDRTDPRALRLLAAALRALGQDEAAAEAELRAIRAGFTPALRRARAAQQAGRNREAKAIVEDHLRNNPDDLLATTIAAQATLHLDGPEQAEPLLRTVVSRAPGFPPASLLLATSLKAQLRLWEAAEIVEGLRKRVPHEINATRFLGDLRGELNDPAAAAELYRDVVAAQPNSAPDQYKYGQFLRSTGRREESVTALRKAAELSPSGGDPWWTLVHFFPEDVSDGDERDLRDALVRPDVSPESRRLLFGAASLIHHRRGRHAEAFESVARAKAAAPGARRYDSASLTRHVDELFTAYTPELLSRVQDHGLSSSAPIFIVGLPRSGSTLLERILGQHSKIEAVGDIPVLPRLVGMEQPSGTASYRSLLPDQLAQEALATMARWYLDRADQFRRTDKPHFTDKYNGNWIRTGLVRQLFPNARILDIRRKPLDSCWSVYRSLLVDDYANDLRDLGRYYADYVRFMDAMSAASPDAVLTISYENLVSNVEAEVRRILSFLALEFEAACVDFHLSNDAVRTASSEQVRRPVSRDAIGSADPYRPWLQPLIEELESALGKI